MLKSILISAVILFAVPTAYSQAATDNFQFEASLTAMEYAQSTTTTKPKDGDSSKETESTFVTSPFDLELKVSKQQWAFYLQPSTASDSEGGVLGIGYLVTPDLELGFKWSQLQKQTKEEGESTKSHHRSFELFATYAVALENQKTLELGAGLVNLNAEFESGSTTTGTGFGLGLALLVELSDNLTYAGSIGLTKGSAVQKEEGEAGASQEYDVDMTSLTIAPLALKFSF